MRIDGVGVPYDGSVTEAKFANPESVHASYMERQALLNSNFDIWQQGTTFTNITTGTTTADRYNVGFSAASGGVLPTTVTNERLTLTPGDITGSFYGYRITVDGAGTLAANNFYLIAQDIANGVRFLSGLNKKITISFYARSSIAGKKIGANVANFYGTGGSPSGAQIDNPGGFVTLTNTWQKYTITSTAYDLTGKVFGTDNNDILQLRIFLTWGTGFAFQVGTTGTETFGGAGTIDIAQVQVCAGDVALPYDPKTITQELENITGGISGKIVPSNSDMNTLLTTGIYYSDNASGILVNGPNQGSDSSWWELQVSVSGLTTPYIYQILKMTSFEYSRYKLGGGAFTAWARSKTFGKTTIDSSDFNNNIPSQAATQADSTATDVAGLVTDFNALLAKLKTAKLMG